MQKVYLNNILHQDIYYILSRFVFLHQDNAQNMKNTHTQYKTYTVTKSTN